MNFSYLWMRIKKIGRVSARRLSIYNFAWGLLKPEGHQKSIFNTPKVKKKQRYIGISIRQILQAQPKNIKKIIYLFSRFSIIDPFRE
jgi:hypothetical protein